MSNFEPMGKTFVFGDIHGCYDEFVGLLHQMGVADTDTIVSVGDIVDRGPKSQQLFQFFTQRPNSVVLMGNHERKHLNQVLNYAQEIVKLQMGDDYEPFLKWIETLPYYYETADAIIVHAAFENDILLENQKEEVLCGSTAGEKYLEKKYPEGTYWTDYYTGHKPIIYGHHVVGDTVKSINNTLGIDTGACHGGYLTAIELPGLIVHQIKSNTDYWKNELKKWQIPVLKSKNWALMKFDAIEKQLNKLAYNEDSEVISYLNALKNRLETTKNKLAEIKLIIESLAKELAEKHGADFNKEVSKLTYSSFVFKAKNGQLDIATLEKSLDTPEKVYTLAILLGIENISPWEV